MSVETNIQKELIGKFGFLENNIRTSRPRRIFAEVSADNFEKVFEYAVKELYFVMLCGMTGMDDGATFSFMYHIAREDGIMLNLKLSVDKNNPLIKTVTGYFPGADIYEREVMDLLGAKVKGLPEGTRYPLSDDWPTGEYPLRKDWKRSQEGVKNNA